jgi:streptogramin lyase
LCDPPFAPILERLMSTLSRPLHSVVIVLALLLLSGAWSGAAAQVKLFPITTASTLPEGIAAGPDGNLWFTEALGNKIGRMTTAGAMLSEFSIPTADAFAEGIAAGPDGNMWFTEAFADKIGRVTPAGTITEFALPTSGSGPIRIAVGVDGALWFVENGAHGNRIGRITTAGAISEFPIPTASAGLLDIAAGPDGALWFVEQAADKIGRITIAGSVTEFAIPTANSQPAGIVAGPEGEMWFTEQSGNNIGQITLAGVITENPVPNAGPFGITAGPDQALWFAELASNAIGRITTDPTASEIAIGQTCAPTKFVFAQDGNVYFNCTDATRNSIGQYTLPRLVTLSVTGDQSTTGFGFVDGHNVDIECDISAIPFPAGQCGALVAPGTTVSLNAAASAGSVFSGWTQGCSGTGQCVLTIFTDTMVTAKFAASPTAGLLEVVPVDTGSASPFVAGSKIVSSPSGIDCPFTCTASFAPGTVVTLTATDGFASQFSGFSGGGCSGTGACAVTIPPPTIAVAGVVTVDATFSPTTAFAGGPLESALLPTGRSVTSPSIAQPGTATVFATMINIGTTTATGCAIQPSPTPNFSGNFSGGFVYQPTNPTTNQLTGTANTPVNIPGGGSQSFVLGFTPTLPFSPLKLGLTYACANAGAAPTVFGLNTVGLSASTSPIPDVITVGATLTNDQILHITGSAGSGAFAVATFNLGASAMITVTANTGASNIPLMLNLCQTNPQSGQCISPIGPMVTTQINNGDTPTFAVFVSALNQVILDPADNRIFVSLTDPIGALRGGTSVAVETQ